MSLSCALSQSKDWRGGWLHLACVTSCPLPGLHTPDGTCLLPFVDETARRNESSEVTDSLCRSWTKSTSPNSWSGGLHTHGAVSPSLPDSPSLSGRLQVGELDSYFSPWHTGHSATSPRAKTRTGSAPRGFSQGSAFSLPPLQELVLLPPG